MDFLDRFNEFFYDNIGSFGFGFLLGFGVCFMRFVW